MKKQNESDKLMSDKDMIAAQMDCWENYVILQPITEIKNGIHETIGQMKLCLRSQQNMRPKWIMENSAESRKFQTDNCKNCLYEITKWTNCISANAADSNSPESKFKKSTFTREEIRDFIISRISRINRRNLDFCINSYLQKNRFECLIEKFSEAKITKILNALPPLPYDPDKFLGEQEQIFEEKL